MKLSLEQIVSIISAVGISTIISTVFSFIQTNKKNNLEFRNKKRPKNYCCHPILFYEYRKNKRRIAKEVLKWKGKN